MSFTIYAFASLLRFSSSRCISRIEETNSDTYFHVSSTSFIASERMFRDGRFTSRTIAGANRARRHAHCDVYGRGQLLVRGQVKVSIKRWKILFLRGGNFEIKGKFHSEKLDCIATIVSRRTLRATRTLSLPLNYAFIRRLSGVTEYFLHYTYKQPRLHLFLPDLKRHCSRF